MYISPAGNFLALLSDLDPDDPVTMLNLLRFRVIADYRCAPQLAPELEVSGRRAYEQYARLALPLVEKVGGQQLFAGGGGHYLIGPREQQWDLVVLVRYPKPRTFESLVTSSEYAAIAGHRTAALSDSRLLPIGSSDFSSTDRVPGLSDPLSGK